MFSLPAGARGIPRTSRDGSPGEVRSGHGPGVCLREAPLLPGDECDAPDSMSWPGPSAVSSSASCVLRNRLLATIAPGRVLGHGFERSCLPPYRSKRLPDRGERLGLRLLSAATRRRSGLSSSVSVPLSMSAVMSRLSIFRFAHFPKSASCFPASMSASSSTAWAERRLAPAAFAQPGESVLVILSAVASWRLTVLPEMVLPVCAEMMSALMSSVRLPRMPGSSSRRRSTSRPRALVAATRSVAESSRVKRFAV